MQNQKYEIMPYPSRNIGDHTLYMIRATKSFTACSGAYIEDGTFGGWIEDPSSLPQDDRSWVEDGCIVYNNSFIFNSYIGNHSLIIDSEIHNSFVRMAIVNGRNLNYAFLEGGRYETYTEDYNA